MNTTTSLPLNDPSQWPLRMTRREVAQVCRISERELRRRIKQGRFPKTDDGVTWSRGSVETFVAGKVRDFERTFEQEQRRQQRRGAIAMVGGR